MSCSCLNNLMFKQKYFKYFDLSDFCFIDEEFVEFIDCMSPTIRHLNLQGSMLELWVNQSISDVISPFRFLSSLRLSTVSCVTTLDFLWFAPITLKDLRLDFLHMCPAQDFVQYVPILSNQLTTLYVTHNYHLTKYDIVPMLQRFNKLEVLYISDSDYITPGTCETIARYCYNLDKFYFTMNFRMRDCKAWIELLGMDLEHLEFSADVNSHLETYYYVENVYECHGWDFDSEEETD